MSSSEDTGYPQTAWEWTGLAIAPLVLMALFFWSFDEERFSNVTWVKMVLFVLLGSLAMIIIYAYFISKSYNHDTLPSVGHGLLLWIGFALTIVVFCFSCFTSMHIVKNYQQIFEPAAVSRLRTSGEYDANERILKKLKESDFEDKEYSDDGRELDYEERHWNATHDWFIDKYGGLKCQGATMITKTIIEALRRCAKNLEAEPKRFWVFLPQQPKKFDALTMGEVREFVGSRWVKLVDEAKRRDETRNIYAAVDPSEVDKVVDELLEQDFCKKN